jgi:hypothetical protein
MNLFKEKRMKHLKKILLAVVIVAILVTSIATVALADTVNYTGNVDEAQKLLGNAESASAVEGSTLADAKSESLAALYTYLVTVDPNATGYAEVANAYNQLTFKVAYVFVNSIKEEASDSEIADAVLKTYLHLAKAPVVGTSDVTINLSYTCAACEITTYFDSNSIFAGITDDSTCHPDCTSDEPYQYSNPCLYSNFKKSLNDTSLEVTEILIDKMFAMVEDAKNQSSYYDFLVAKKAAEDCMNSLNILSYVEPDSSVYTGKLSDVQAKIALISVDSSYGELKAGLKDIYKYLVNTPVNPTLDGYLKFIKKYDSCCDALVSKFEAAATEAATPTDKVAVLSEMYTYLTDGAVSEKLVNAYNEKRAELHDEYAEIAGSVESAELLGSIVPEVVYQSDLSEFEEVIATAESKLTGSAATFKRNIKKVYTYVSKLDKPLDPAADGYAALMARCDALVQHYISLYVNAIDEQTTISGKYAKVKDFCKNANPALSSAYMPVEAAIKAYNLEREKLLAKAKAFADGLGEDSLPKYEAPAAPEVTADEGILEALLSDVKAAQKAYTEASVENKATSFDGFKKAVNSLYTYLSGAVVDTEASFFDSFVTDYSAIRDAFVLAMLEKVDSAEDVAGKTAALGEVKAYLSAYPLSKSAIVLYNTKVDEVYSEDAAAASASKLSSVYFEFDALAEKMTNDAELSDMLTYGKQLYEYSKLKYDVTDSAYEELLATYDSKDAMLGERIANEIEAVLKVSTESAVSTIQYYASYLTQNKLEKSISALSDAVKNEIKDCQIIISNFENNIAEVAYIVSPQENVINLASSYKEETTLEGKMNAFEALYNALTSNNNTFFISGESYGAAVSAYNEVKALFEAELSASLNVFTSPVEQYDALARVKNYLDDVPFSQAVADAYNVALTAAKNANFIEFAEKINTDTHAVSYATPDGWEGDFTAIGSELNTMIDSEDDISADFVNLNNNFAGIPNTAKKYDFAKIGFVELIEKYNSLAIRVADSKASLIVAENSAENNAKAIKAFYKYLNGKQMPLCMVQTYNSKREQVVEMYIAEAAEKSTLFSDSVTNIHEFMNACKVDVSILSEEQKALYSELKFKLSALEYAELGGYVYKFENATGAFALVVKNSVVDKLNWYKRTYALDSGFTNSKFAEFALAEAFADYLEKFEESIATLSEDEQATEIDILGSYLIYKNFPEFLVKMYNEAFECELVAAPYTGITAEGTLEEFAIYMTNVLASKSLSEQKAYIAVLVEYLNQNPLSKSSEMSAVNSDISEIQAELSILTQKQKEAADSKANLSDYSLTTQVNHEHESGKLYKPNLSPSSDKEWTHKLVSASGNKYAEQTSLNSASIYFNVDIEDSTQGIVIEFDLMAPDVLESFSLSFTEDGLNDSSLRVMTNILNIEDGMLLYGQTSYLAADKKNNNGYDQGYSLYKKEKAEPIYLVPGEWMHFIIIINPDTQMAELMVDYVSLGTKKIVSADAYGQIDTCLFTQLRFKNTAKYSTYCYDNIVAYGGTSYRNRNKFDTMSDMDKFKFYVDYMTSEGLDINGDGEISESEEYSSVSRIFAYNGAKALYTVGSSNAQYKAKYDSFNVRTISAAAQEEHIGYLQNALSELNLENINTGNLAEQKATVDSAKAYIERYGTNIDQSDPRFLKEADKISKAEAEMQRLSDLEDFIDVLKHFHRAPTLVALEKHRESVNAAYALCKLDESVYYEAASKDPVVTKFLESVADDAKKLIGKSNLTLDEYCKLYIQTRIDQQRKYENSIKIIDCIGFIESLVTDETLTGDAFMEALLAKATENVDFVSPYLDVISNIINNNDYDSSYDGVDAAIATYEKLDELFYQIIQTQHLAVVKEKLDRYVVSTSYIEKAGICTYIENYIEENHVNMTSAEGVQYAYALEVYKSELVTYKIDYEQVLAVNTNAFLAVVSKMTAYVTYEELKPLYDEAIENYYYSMNVDSEAVKAAIAVFEEYESFIEKAEENSAMFLGYVDTLTSARRQSHIYRALVNCGLYVDGADDGVEGVKEAKETYKTKLAEYNASISPINSEISETVDVACSVRSNTIAATVLAVIKNIFGK